MAQRHNDISRLQNVRGMPNTMAGLSTGLVEAEVVAIHTKQGTLDARQIGGRSVSVGASYPRWYEPQLHDRVLVAELQGDARQRVVLQVMSTSTGGKPKIKSG